MTTDLEGADVLHPETPPRPDRWRTVAQTLGEILVTGGLVVLLFVVYELFITDVITDQRQDELSEQLHDGWDASPTVVPIHESKLGDAFAVLHIPRLGADYSRAIAGHRVGRGSPFLDLDQMQPGDPIVVETADAWFV